MHRSAAVRAQPIGITASIAARRLSGEQWPELVHPFASAIDTELPKPPSSVHLLLRGKAGWVEPQICPNHERFDGLSRIVDRRLAQTTRAVDRMTVLPLGRLRALFLFGSAQSYLIRKGERRRKWPIP